MSIFASKSPQWTMSARDSSNVGMLLKASTNSCEAFCRGTALLLGFVCPHIQHWKCASIAGCLRNTSHPASKSRTMAGSSMISDFPSTSTMMAHRSPSRFSAGTGSVRAGVESSQRLCRVSQSVGTWVFSTQSPALPTCSRHFPVVVQQPPAAKYLHGMSCERHDKQFCLQSICRDQNRWSNEKAGDLDSSTFVKKSCTLCRSDMIWCCAQLISMLSCTTLSAWS